jgi:hypothetical protein
VWYFFETVIMYGQIQICIDASVGIDILILKYKGEGEERCILSETFVMKIRESTTKFALMQVLASTTSF